MKPFDLPPPVNAGASYNLADMSAARLFAGPPPPVKWLIQDIMPLGKLAVVASPPGVGKSFLLADLACKVAAPSLAAYSLGGAVAAKGKVVYISAEDDLPELHRRIHALTNGSPPQNLYCLSLPDNGGCFSVVQTDRQTKETAVTPQWAELARQIETMDGVKLLIVDTLQAMSQGDTNAAHEVQPMMNELSRLSAVTGATVVLVHHVGKGTTREIKTALDASEAVRGSGAIVGAARSVYTLWPAPEPKAIEICEALSLLYAENRVIFGMVAKANAKAYQGRTVFVRSDNGVLVDRTTQVGHILGGQRQTDRVCLVGAIVKAAREGKPFAASHSQAGLHSRRDEIGKEFINRSRDWFASMAAELLAEGVIQRKPKGAGFVLVPADSDTDAIQANDEIAA